LRRARQATGAGRGEHPREELGRSRAVAPARGGAVRAARPTSDAGVAQARPVHRAEAVGVAGPARLRWTVWAAGVVGVIVLVTGTYLVIGARNPRPAEAPSGQVAQLAQAVIENQLELARRRLDARDYAEAARQAERVLQLDAENADAKEIAAKARRTLGQIDSATAAVRAAVRAGDTDKAAGAIWSLLLLDPNNPEAAQLLEGANSAFGRRLEEAQRLMTEARSAAGKAQASREPAFSEAVGLARQAETDARAGRPAAACRGYLLARDRFERAIRTRR